MTFSRDIVHPNKQSRAIFAAVAMFVVALGMGGCAAPMGVSDRSPLLDGTQDAPPRAETMQEFVGLPRPN